jgi:hypothetical protein
MTNGSGSGRPRNFQIRNTDHHLQTSVVDRHRFDADPDPTFHPRVYKCGKIKKNLAFIHISAGLHCFIFFFSLIGAIIFNIFDSIFNFEISWKMCRLALYLSKWIRVRQKDCRSDRIRIHNTAYRHFCESPTV